MAASTTGAIVLSLFMTPLDVVKVRLQAQQSQELRPRCYVVANNGLVDPLCGCQSSFTQSFSTRTAMPVHIQGTIDGLIKIGRYEGIPSLWTGLAPTLLITVPSTVLYFTTYEQLKSRMEQVSNSPAVPGIAGSLARIFAVIIISPFELARTKLQASRTSYTELAAILRGEIKSNGVRSMWKGLVPTLLRDVPFTAIYWCGYEMVKKMMGQPKQPTMTTTLVAGSVAGGIAATLTLPLDVVKTHRQLEIGDKHLCLGAPKSHKLPKSTLSHLNNIYARQGIRGLFAGLPPRLAKVVPACAIMISSYEYSKAYFINKSEEKNRYRS